MYTLVLEDFNTDEVHNASTKEEMCSILTNLNVKTLTGSLKLEKGSFIMFNKISLDDVVSCLSLKINKCVEYKNEGPFQVSKKL